MLRRAGFWLVALAAPFLGSHQVLANYTEAHLGGVDVRVTIARDGHFTVAHKLTYHVLAGAMRSLTLQGFEEDLRFAPTGTATTADGRSFGLTVARDDKGLHVGIDDPKGLKRGDYTLELDYEGALAGKGVASRLVLEGAFYRLRFATPPMSEGVDGMRVVLDLPSAPTEPRLVTSSTDGDESELPALRRGAERDELELVRPHVAKGQGITWGARVDPKALPAVDDPGLRPRAAVPVLPTSSRSELPAIVAAAAALAFFALALAKQRLLSAKEKTPMRGLVPMPATARAILSSVALGAGVYAEGIGHTLIAAALVALALPLVAWHAEHAVRTPRASGGWLVLRPQDAFADSPCAADWLDATTTRGRLLLGAAACALAVAAFFVRHIEGVSYWIGIDGFALVPIFFSGTSHQSPPDARRAAAALLPIARALESERDLRVAPYARADELRLLVVPRLAMPGVVGVEVAIAWERAGGAMLATYEVLVRVHDASFASAKMAAYAVGPRGGPRCSRPLPGRKPEERVYRFEPSGPSLGSVVDLVSDLCDVLRDRRVIMATPAEWEGAERRLPPNVRRALAASA